MSETKRRRGSWACSGPGAARARVAAVLAATPLVGALLVAGVAALGCREAPPPASTPTRTTAASAPAPERDGLVARLEAERDDALHRALDTRKESEEARGRCQLIEHDLESLRERDAFEDAIWSGLDHAAIDERAVRALLAGASRDRRRALDGALRDVAAAREAIHESLRRVHAVSEREWPRFKHDVESATEGLQRVLRDAR